MRIKNLESLIIYIKLDVLVKDLKPIFAFYYKPWKYNKSSDILMFSEVIDKNTIGLGWVKFYLELSVSVEWIVCKILCGKWADFKDFILPHLSNLFSYFRNICYLYILISLFLWWMSIQCCLSGSIFYENIVKVNNRN